MALRRTGSADLPLHGGHCPPWLFVRMRLLGAAITEAIVTEFGTTEFLRRLAEPIWFQALGAVLGFDWHSSGLTTVVCGALKEGLGPRQAELGLHFAGGKGRASRQTPAEIAAIADAAALPGTAAELVAASRLAAKVDSAALQDGFALYHHFFAFDRGGGWAVVQQGLRQETATARRYHWLGEAVTDFADEPHAAVAGPAAPGPVLNMVAHGSLAARTAGLDFIRQPPAVIARELAGLARADGARPRPAAQSLFGGEDALQLAVPHGIPGAGRIDAALARLYADPPGDYGALLLAPGIGPAAVRALAMVAEVTYGAPPAHTDPVRYAFAHGGKDGHPFPVRRRLYDHSIQVLQAALERARVGDGEQTDALRRLAGWRAAQGVRE